MGGCARATDGRRIAYETWGDPKGSPIFLLHGTPGSRWGPRPRAHELGLMGIRLIAYDRPGYGDSDRRAGRQVVDAAADVAVIADSLGLDRFAVVGRSGGGPHALACAARLSDRVTAAAALVSLAPRCARGLDWFAGMGESNARVFTTAWQATDAAADPARTADLVDELAHSTSSLLERNYLDGHLGAELPDPDREILHDPGIRGLLAENLWEAVANEQNLAMVPDVPVTGAERRPVLAGWLDDSLAFSRAWGFHPHDICVPVLLWHGDQDVFSPVGHSRWLAGRIPRSKLVIDSGSAHFGSLVVLPAVLQWLCRYTPPAGAG